MYMFILLLTVATASALIDCDAACRSCRDRSGDGAIIEVYCSMCEECSDKRRVVKYRKTDGDQVRYEEFAPSEQDTRSTDNIYRSILNQYATIRAFNSYDRTTRKRRTAYPTRRNRYMNSEDSDSDFLEASHRKSFRYEDYPEGCPLPPECSDYDDSYEEPPSTRHTTPKTTMTTTTTTTTTTTPKPCPPITGCRPKKRRIPPQKPTPSVPFAVPMAFGVPLIGMGMGCSPCMPPPYPFPPYPPPKGVPYAGAYGNSTLIGLDPPGGHNPPNGNNPPHNQNPSIGQKPPDQENHVATVLPSPVVVVPPPPNESPLISEDGFRLISLQNISTELPVRIVSASDYLYMYVGVPKNVIKSEKVQ